MKRITTPIALLVFFVGLFLISSVAQAQQKELKVLFVGNSYTYGNNLPHIVSILSDSTEIKLITRKSVIGGAYLREHWNGERELITREIIATGEFDIVVLQNNSMAALKAPDSTFKYVKLFAEYNDQHGAETYLFNTWAREKVPQFQPEIDAMYQKAALESDAIRVPVGPAWELAQEIRPTIDLFTSDGSHPNELGTLLTACVFVKSITGELPLYPPGTFKVEDAAGETLRLMGSDPLDFEFCKRVANEMMDKHQMK
jgi:hypothetical protein